MKKRLIALSMTLILFITLCLNVSGLGNNTSSYNSGTRHVVCTSLSSDAQSYYTSGYDYDTLSQKTSSQLLQSLRKLMKDTHGYNSTYNDCKYLADQVDSTSGDGRINLIYSSKYTVESKLGSGGAVWNREHVWPKSLGGFNTSGAGADLHHIRPSDATVNNKRSNEKYGNVNNGTPVYGSALVDGVLSGWLGGGYFEPLDNAKGDVARICLYVYVRYGGEITKCSSITNVFQSVDVLLEWCELDPVDEWEMGRNDVVEEIQGNRNVFIDYPEYAWMIFAGEEVPEDMTTPSGKASQTTTPGETPPPTVTEPTEPGTTPEITPPGSDPEITPPGSDPEITPPGSDPEITPPGSDPQITPPGSDPEITPPESDPEITPPGSDPEITPPESEPEITPPGSDPEITPPEPDPEITPPEPDPEITPPGSGSEANTPAPAPETTAPDTEPSGDADCTHSFGEWEDIGNGMKTRTCSLCGISEASTQKDDVSSEVGCTSVVCGMSVVIVQVALLGCALAVRKKERKS